MGLLETKIFSAVANVVFVLSTIVKHGPERLTREQLRAPGAKTTLA